MNKAFKTIGKYAIYVFNGVFIGSEYDTNNPIWWVLIVSAVILIAIHDKCVSQPTKA